MFSLLLTILLIILFIWFKFHAAYWEKRQIPGPRPWPILGNLSGHFCGKSTLGEVIVDIYKKYDGYPFVGIFRANTPCLLVRDPELVSRILVKDFKSFHNNELVLDKNIDPLFGRNPFILRDQEWKETRQMLTPGFTSGRMKFIYPILYEITGKFVKFIENHPTATTDGIETRTLTKRLTLDNVAKTAFGIDGKSLDNFEKISDFHELADQFISPGTSTALLWWISTLFPILIKCFSYKMVPKEAESKLLSLVAEILKHRRENNIQANDFLQYLLQMGIERNLSDVEITAHACTFFIDGYETSSLVLTFLLLNLARNPIYQQKIREEVTQYEKKNNGVITYESLQEMEWLNACFYESIRLTPPVDIMIKVCTRPYEYTSIGYEFKNISIRFTPGDIVILPYGILSKDERYFSNSEKFFPERMMEKGNTNKDYYFPFGNGPRACIGQRFGLMQVKLAATQIIKNFNLSLSPKLQQPVKLIPYHFLNEVRGGVWLKYNKISI